MIEELKSFFFKTAKAEARIQSELIEAIRVRMQAIPDLNVPGLKAWQVGRVYVVATSEHNLLTIAVMQRGPDREPETLMSWMEVDGEITRMERKGFTVDDLVMHALS